jgi:hypothetical protein
MYNVTMAERGGMMRYLVGGPRFPSLAIGRVSFSSSKSAWLSHPNAIYSNF